MTKMLIKDFRPLLAYHKPSLCLLLCVYHDYPLSNRPRLQRASGL